NRHRRVLSRNALHRGRGESRVLEICTHGSTRTPGNPRSYSTAFARALLEKRGLFDNETYTAFTHKAGLVPGSSRCLGWDSPTINSSSGSLFSEQSFGHAGFTGTSLWFDTQRQLAIILLSNAVYPRRECKEVAFVQERRKIYDQVMKYALRQA
ncbi:MAG: serine hydrolase, partial [Oligosphaeraceae bacterium]|nr:serine hydrolase [Oligosphaeraceae bacterium]